MRDRHGSSEQSEFTTNNSGLTMSCGKNVILIIVYIKMDSRNGS